MYLMPYLVCGLFYCFYSFDRIYKNWDRFLEILGEDGREVTDIDIKTFLAFTFITSLLAWPIMIFSELKNRQDMM